MTERKRLFGWCGLFVVAVIFGGSSQARAQGGQVRDDTSAVTAGTQTTTKRWWEERFAGSNADLTNYFGSGSFYASGYSDPYVSTAFSVRPIFKLGTKRGLSVGARVYLELEYTKPDNPTGRRTNLLDTWLYLAAKNLYTEARSKIRISGSLRASLPTSFESRYSHLVVALTAGLGANRSFEFGRPDPTGKKWDLSLSLGESFSKNVHTSHYRGNFPGDTSGCRLQQGNVAAGLVGSGSDGSAASSTDRCGGPLNTNFSFSTSVGATLTRRRFSLSTTLILINQFQYAVPQDMFSAINTISTGRRDATWGLVSLSYEITDHFGASIGLSSYQPALDSTFSHPRFPFFDFAGPNANNFTQVFAGVNGTI